MADATRTTRFRFWLWLIRMIGVIVPRRLRADWRREWEAELRYREELLAEWDRLDWRAKLDLLRRSTSAFWDALWLQPKRLEDEMFQDVHFGMRMLLKHKGFTAVAVLTLALGIGANTAIFSVVNAVLLRPLPYEESGRLVFLNEYTRQFGTMAVSWLDFVDWRAQQTVFEQMGIYNFANYNLTSRGEPEQLQAAQASADLFATLRVKAALGRIFTSDEDRPGAPAVVVLSHGLWQRRFGADPNILNQSITLNASSFTVIGVMAPNFLFPGDPDLWIPVGTFSDQPAAQNRGAHPGLRVMGRLKPGATLEQARAVMNTIAARLEQQYPGTNRSVGVRIIPMLEDYVGDVRRGLWLLLGAVGLVLLIACVNVANLMLARAATRRREMAVRIALGAGRGRLLRQLLTESAMLASAGAALGLPLAAWGVKFILAVSPNSIPRAGEINLDGRVLVFTAAVSLLTGIIFGIAPAIQSGRVDAQETLKETARGATGGRLWLRHGLVITEIALTLVLLVGAGLLLHSFYRLQQASLGLVTEHVLNFRVNLPQQKYASEQQKTGFVNQVMEKLRAQPGVEAVSVASRVPLSSSGMWQTQFLPDGQSLPESGQAPSMEVAVVSPDYFRTLAIPLLRGRYFTEQDNRSDLREETLQGLTPAQRMMAGLKVMIVDEEFARRHWPNEDAVGKRVRFGMSPSAPVATVVGVVGRVKLDGLTAEKGLAQGYFPFLQTPVSAMTFAIKTTLEPERLIAAARRQVLAVDSEQPISEIGSFAEMRSESVAPQRLNLLLLGLFAAVALLLAVVGVYGVMSYTVTQRTREIGIRLALGAQGRDVLGLVVRQGLALLFIGIVIGLAVAFILTRVMAALLFEVSPTDPVIFVSIPLLLMVVALLACWIPARRATKIDPLVALRQE